MDCSQSMGLNPDLVWPHTYIDISRPISLIRAVDSYSRMYIQIVMGLVISNVMG